MVRIELTSQEAEELSSILDDYLSDLRMEIVDTEGHDFRVMLKKRKDLVKRFLDQLKGAEGLKISRSARRRNMNLAAAQAEKGFDLATRLGLAASSAPISHDSEPYKADQEAHDKYKHADRIEELGQNMSLPFEVLAGLMGLPTDILPVEEEI